MPEQFLHHSKVSAAFEHVGRSRMSKSMRCDIRSTRHRSNKFMYNRSHTTRVDPTTTRSQKERILASGREQLSARVEPLLQRLCCWNSKRHHAFLVALTSHSHDSSGLVDVSDIEPAKFGDPDAASVKKFEHGSVASSLRITIVRADSRVVEHRLGFGRRENLRKMPVWTWTRQSGPRVDRNQPSTTQPRRERSRCSGPTSQ